MDGRAHKTSKCRSGQNPEIRPRNILLWKIPVPSPNALVVFTPRRDLAREIRNWRVCGNSAVELMKCSFAKQKDGFGVWQLPRTIHRVEINHAAARCGE